MIRPRPPRPARRPLRRRTVAPSACAILIATLMVAFPSAAATPVASAPKAGPREVPWDWPTASPVLIAHGFVAPATPYTAGHRGIDLEAMASTGAEVRAPTDSTVSFVGQVVDRPVLTLAVGADVLVSFEPLESPLRVGDRVARGQVIGALAIGGHCEASCLHVGVRVAGEYVSPLLFFDRVPRAVLLPLHTAGQHDPTTRGDEHSGSSP